MQETIFSSIPAGGLTLKNRIVFAPTTVGEHGLERYERIAKGGAGLIILPDVSVVPSMLGTPSLDTMEYADYFRSVLGVCRQYGCKVSVQLFHPEYDTAYIGGLYRKRGNLRG